MSANLAGLPLLYYLNGKHPLYRANKTVSEPLDVLARAGIPGLKATLKDSRGGLRVYLLEFASDTAADSAASPGRN